MPGGCAGDDSGGGGRKGMTALMADVPPIVPAAAVAVAEVPKKSGEFGKVRVFRLRWLGIVNLARWA